MDWLKDITAEEIKSLLLSVSEKERRRWICNSGEWYNVLYRFQELRVAKRYKEGYGSYFECTSDYWYLYCIGHLRNDNCDKFARFGQFGGVAYFKDGYDDNNRYVVYRLDDFLIEAPWREYPSVETPLKYEIGRRFFAFVAQKNRGVLDENGNTYEEAYLKAQKDVIDEHLARMQRIFDRGAEVINQRFNREKSTISQILKTEESGDNSQMQGGIN